MGRLKNNKIGSAGYVHFHASTTEEYFKTDNSRKADTKNKIEVRFPDVPTMG